MAEIQGKSILVRVSEVSSYWESTLLQTTRDWQKADQNRSIHSQSSSLIDKALRILLNVK